MDEKCVRSLDELIDDDELTTEAIWKGVRNALLAHARAGHPVPICENGKIAWVAPDEIYRGIGHPIPGEPKTP